MFVACQKRGELSPRLDPLHNWVKPYLAAEAKVGLHPIDNMWGCTTPEGWLGTA